MEKLPTKTQLFENKKVRNHWDAAEQEWYWSVVDVCGVLTEQSTQDGARKYWSVLKLRLKDEGSELTTICSQLKMSASDGKMRETDVLNTQGILRLIQSIPSKKAEPFKMWLANIGNERLDEIADPEKAIDRAIMTYKKKGYSDKWIEQRLKSKEIHDELIHTWSEHGIEKPVEFAVLTDEVLKTWSGKSTAEYKDFKNLKKENLRDNLSQMELVLAMLGFQACEKRTAPINCHCYFARKDIQ